jgi:hypothetical protein
MKMGGLPISLATLVVTAASIVGCATTSASPDTSTATIPNVAWNEVGEQHLGKTVSVCGPVALALSPTPGRNDGLPATLGSLVLGGDPVTDVRKIMGEPWRFKVVIRDYHSGFPQNPAEYYKGKDVCVAGQIVLALVGGYEILATHPSQIAIQGKGAPTLPHGQVKKLPAGAIHYTEAPNHFGQTKTVCGVVLSGGSNLVPAKMFPPGFQVPENITKRLPPDFKLSTDTRTMHELNVGDRISFTVWILADAAKSLPQPALDYYLNKDVCFTGKLAPSLTQGAETLIEDLSNVKVLD